MAIREQGDYWYGDTAADIREVLMRTCGSVHPLTQFADAVCDCGSRDFSLMTDAEDGGEACWFCKSCQAQYLFHDRLDESPYSGSDEAELEFCDCICRVQGASYFEITVGVSLYDNRDDVRWVYIGCRCVSCGLTGLYASWNRVDIPYPKLFANMRNRQVDE